MPVLVVQQANDRSLERSILEPFLASEDCPEHTMNFCQLDGYFRALAGAPIIKEIQEWQPLIFADKKPVFKSKETADSITNALIRLYNFHLSQVVAKVCDLPCLYSYTENREHRIDIEQWARGFLQGYILVQDVWETAFESHRVAKNLTDIQSSVIFDEIDAILSTVSSVADAEYALHKGVSIASLKEMFKEIPKCIVNYGQMGQRFQRM